MAETFKKIVQTQPGTSAATVYTAPALTQTIIKQIRAVNTSTTVASTVGLFHDGTAATNRILPDVPLNPGEWLVEDCTIFMETADTLAAIASVASTISLVVYGVEIV